MQSESKRSDLNYTLPEFPNGAVPTKIIVTEHAKKAFSLARNRQGFVGIAWLGKDIDHPEVDVLYLDVMPAFNKNDNRPRSDKKGNEYKEEKDEYVYSDEPLGGNSGVNHISFFNILRKRVNQAETDHDENTLKMFEGSS